jgi:6-hydroxycyclohex-1-ene-1-carbonyl-CoA dehydrogenase
VTDAAAFFLETPSRPLVWRDLEVAAGPGEALVEVAACGLCHTDLSFASGAVAPRHDLPLVLGHEITGRVVAAGEGAEHLLGRPVLVPAVLPCGDCAWCRAGRSNACPSQRMPGNDVHGGFASHVALPARFLVPLDDAPAGFPLADLAVVADAVSTAWQAVRRAALVPGDAAFVVGAGGVGAFVVQVARALGARVAACDPSSERLALAAEHGAEAVVRIAGDDERAVRRQVHGLARDWGVPAVSWRIFECSGTPQGQTLAWSLLSSAATLVQVGYTPDRVSLRLSSLMAYDATACGSWGCPPESYPDVLRLVWSGEVVLAPFLEHAPLSDLNELLADMAAHRLRRRMILHPNGAR